VNLPVALTTFALVFLAELPDKTMVATLVLSTRYRALPVLAGVTAAFALQCLIAVTAGRLLALLPQRLVLLVAAALFAIGAVILLRRPHPEEEQPADTRAAAAPLRAAAISFGVLLAAEWGDASQLLTAGLSARYDEAVSVYVGALSALIGVAAVALLLGQVVLRAVPLGLVRRAAGLLFAVLAVLAAVEALRT